MRTTEEKPNADAISQKIGKMSLVGEIVACLGLLLSLVVVADTVWTFFSNGASLDADIAETFLKHGETLSLSAGQRLIGVKLALVTILIGAIGLNAARQLFAGYRKGEVFTYRAASRFSIIGWTLILLVPASKIALNVGRYYFSGIAGAGSFEAEFLLEDVDLYALAFGLLLVVAGQVMRQAVVLMEENRSFI